MAMVIIFSTHIASVPAQNPVDFPRPARPGCSRVLDYSPRHLDWKYPDLRRFNPIPCTPNLPSKQQDWEFYITDRYLALHCANVARTESSGVILSEGLESLYQKHTYSSLSFLFFSFFSPFSLFHSFLILSQLHPPMLRCKFVVQKPYSHS